MSAWPLERSASHCLALAGSALWIIAGAALAQTDLKRGEKLYTECRACHSLEAGVNTVGPTLAGVVGRKAAALDEFRYSPAMKRSNIAWSRQTLDEFIADPQKVVPANRMPYSGLADAKDRADLIGYIVQAARAHGSK
ncbi:MAG: c-type cytochrome [Proteobacteria bacterium]|nr:c-type cytochrome [Burkholderiales bacterium]